MRIKRGDSWCHIPNYVKHTVEDTEKGVTITIYTENGDVHEYICEDVNKKNQKDCLSFALSPLTILQNLHISYQMNPKEMEHQMYQTYHQTP